MSWWPVAVQAIVGVLTAVVSFFAVRWGARETETRSRREEWWRRFAWAASARGDADPALQVAGEAVLEHLRGSELAGTGERDLLLRVQFAAQAHKREEERRRRGLDIGDLNRDDE